MDDCFSCVIQKFSDGRRFEDCLEKQNHHEIQFYLFVRHQSEYKYQFPFDVSHSNYGRTKNFFLMLYKTYFMMVSLFNVIF